MSVASELSYRHVRNTALPYVTASAPTSTNPQYVDGLNVLTSYKGYLERRPGFAPFESTPTQFAGTIQRVFGWRRWGGTFYLMLNEITATNSNVYKLAIGFDPSFVQIFSSASTNIFDFVVSNNFCFFGNGVDMKKFDGTTVTNWGISIGTLNNSIGPNTAATGTNGGGSGLVWASPGNVNSTISFASVTLPNTTLSVASVHRGSSGTGYDGTFDVVFFGGGGSGAAATALSSAGHVSTITVTNGGSGYTSAPGVDLSGGGGIGATATANMTGSGATIYSSQGLQGTNFSLGLSGAETVSGLTASFVAIATNTGGGTANITCTVQLISGGSVFGNPKTVTLIVDGSSHTYSLGSLSDLWGTTLSPTILNGSTFGFQVTIALTAVTSTYSFQANNFQVTVYGAGGPPIAVSGSAGTFSATNGGYEYVYCYYNASTGHISSPTPFSASSGNFTNKLNIGVTLVASTDPQVTNIRLFRTTDGGGGVYFEVQSSPYPNTSGVVTDNTTDANLSVITAPTFGFNDPPPPGYGFVWFANRIWYIDGASPNTIRFTDWEELNIGVAEESCVSGPQGNFWNFDSEATALSVAQDGVIIETAGSIFKIDGDSLDTFRRTTIAKGIGCRNRATIARLGAMTAFLANTNSIWTTDSNSLQEISQMIQPTLDGINHSQASSTFHIQGQNRWLILCDAGHSQTLCYDTNTQQWMPPWSIVGTACGSFETSEGNWDLFLAQQGTNTLLKLTPDAYLDNGVPYAASLTTNPQPIINEHLGAGSAYIDLYYPQNPGQIAYMEYFGADFNAILPADILYEFDDDPGTATYTSIIASQTDAVLKNQGINVKNMWYYLRQRTGRRISIQIQWWAQNSNFKLYTYTVAYRITR